MDTSELYTSMVKRERNLWIALAVTGASTLLISCLFFWMYLGVAKEKSKIIAYTPTGIPKYVEWKCEGGRELIEVQTFTKEMLAKAFTLKYSDFLGAKPADVLAGVKPLFAPDYYEQFVEGLTVSKYIERMIESRAVTIVEVKDPVEVQASPDGYWAKARIVKQDVTATGEKNQILTYAVFLRKGDRTIRNPWGLYVSKIYTVS